MELVVVGYADNEATRLRESNATRRLDGDQIDGRYNVKCVLHDSQARIAFLHFCISCGNE